MDKIVLKHSRIEINNYDLGDCPKLEYIFSVWDPVRFTSFPLGIEYNSDTRQLRLPRGLDIRYIANLFNAEPIVDKQPDPYTDTEPIPIRYLPKDERQLEILKFLLGKEKYAYTRTKSQLAVNSATGSGKTFVTVGCICFLGVRTIIITNQLEWLQQWKEKILEYTPLNESDLFMINGSNSIFKLLNRDPLQYKIFLASHATIKSFGDNYGWNRVEEFFKYIQVGMKVFDEAHLYFENMCRIDFHSNTKRTIYLTATPKRSSKEEDVIYQLFFKNIPSITLFDENTDPHVNYVAMHFNSHPSPIDINKCKNKYGFDRNHYTKYLMNRPNFWKLVTILIDLAMNKNGKTLIYINTNDSITKVYNYIVETMPFYAPYVGIYTSITEKDAKRDNLYKKIILSTTKSCGAAQDIYDLQCTINLAEPFRSPVIAQQTLGRCRLPDTMYIDIVDEGFYFTKMYYKAKKPVFSMYAKTCSDVMLSDEELDNRALSVTEKYDSKKVMCVQIYDK